MGGEEYGGEGYVTLGSGKCGVGDMLLWQSGAWWYTRWKRSLVVVG